jgi:hypothetical protein
MAAALLTVGFLRRSAFLRWQALVLTAVTIAKVFLVDMSELSSGLRILSFIGLGVLLLAVSFVYQRDWLNLRGQKEEPHEMGAALAAAVRRLLRRRFATFQFERPMEMPAQVGDKPARWSIRRFLLMLRPGSRTCGFTRSAIETPYVVRATRPYRATRQVSQCSTWAKAEARRSSMPRCRRSYSDLQLNIDGQNFLATVTVSGSQTQTAARGPSLARSPSSI